MNDVIIPLIQWFVHILNFNSQRVRPDDLSYRNVITQFFVFERLEVSHCALIKLYSFSICVCVCVHRDTLSL